MLSKAKVIAAAAALTAGMAVNAYASGAIEPPQGTIEPPQGAIEPPQGAVEPPQSSVWRWLVERFGGAVEPPQ